MSDLRAASRALRLTLQSARVGVFTGLTEIKTHPLRSSLSATGILFGVAVMTAMLSLIGGMNGFLNDKMGEWMGSLFIWSVDPEKGQEAAFSRSRGLRLSDGLRLEAGNPSVERLYRNISVRGRFSTRAGETGGRFMGVDSATLAKQLTMDVENVILQGRGFTDEDYAKGPLICIVSQLLADDITASLRKSGEPESLLLGSSVTVKNRPFRIVGVYGPKTGKMKRGWMRNQVFAPMKAVQNALTGYDPNPGALWIRVRDPKKMEREIAQVSADLLAFHRGARDFEFNKPENLQEFISMMENVSRIMGVVALISLLSGGLGIMNVMLSSISERVREIGVRKALGAGPVQIFIQFIAEAVTLCFTGGILGTLLGTLPLLFGEDIREATDGVILPALSVTAIAGVSITVALMGILFGLYPALKASRLNPIDALRYE